jgi:hypothetical protein
MRNAIYYKYRSLENFERFINILVNERFYAASYKDLNDIMEGLYIDLGLKPKVSREIKNAKENYRICSFSKINNHPLLWAHYADGSKGVCIGCRITGQNVSIENVTYTGLAEIKNCFEANITAKEILLHKEATWEYEEEVRVLTKNGAKQVKVKIEEIIFGKRIALERKKLIKDICEKFLPNVKFKG